ncbi:hypothetical protein [Marininema halotolerans]|uniref:Uncharacterized protein n=1 Tax=Marininema halotolerans TaxID=1155944 RepID=A0A1I6NTY6_9BACL|nr:hypothetical protein [Marininema halotolerans]SFS31403.1 hypothetical protein SAMN05444972_101130 [Marininema halotolerans]
MIGGAWLRGWIILRGRLRTPAFWILLTLILGSGIVSSQVLMIKYSELYYIGEGLSLLWLITWLRECFSAEVDAGLFDVARSTPVTVGRVVLERTMMAGGMYLLGITGWTWWTLDGSPSSWGFLAVFAPWHIAVVGCFFIGMTLTGRTVGGLITGVMGWGLMWTLGDVLGNERGNILYIQGVMDIVLQGNDWPHWMIYNRIGYGIGGMILLLCGGWLYTLPNWRQRMGWEGSQENE